MAKDENKKALREAYTAATQKLREAHRDEFNRLYQQAAAARGVEWKPRLSREEKAEAQLRRLLDENPGLAAKIAIEVMSVQEGDSAPDGLDDLAPA